MYVYTPPYMHMNLFKDNYTFSLALLVICSKAKYFNRSIPLRSMEHTVKYIWEQKEERNVVGQVVKYKLVFHRVYNLEIY